MTRARTDVRTLVDVASAFLKLGCTSFGGPIAHIGHVRAECVDRRRWIDAEGFADVVALCQLLPGPASSQVVFALGMHRAGIVGAAVASTCFTLPSAVLMLALAQGVAHIHAAEGAGLVHGLKLAAVAVVAHAVWTMARALCPDRARALLCIGATTVLLAIPGPAMHVAVVGVGALVGSWMFRGNEAPARNTRDDAAHDDAAHDAAHVDDGRNDVGATTSLFAYAALLALLPALAAATHNRSVDEFSRFYRAGALVFGGGHVVLPLLRAEVVPSGWLDDDAFLAGYAGAQMMPGPLFTLAGFVGAAMHPGPTAWLHGLWCLAALFLPGWLVVAGALPFWRRLRRHARARAACAGVNAAVVGMLGAALCDPVLREGVRDAGDVVVAAAGCTLLVRWKVPGWLVVAMMAGVGAWRFH